MDEQQWPLPRQVSAPNTAAAAGILFCMFLITSQLLIWMSVPPDGRQPAMEFISHSTALSVALNLRPFAGMAFLWFIAVIRNRVGELEDRFFSTVFLGSGLLYIAMIFTSAALAGGLIRVLAIAPEVLERSGAYALGRAQVYQTMNVYGIRMAGVFMFSTGTILLRTAIVARWIALLGYALGVSLLLATDIIVWIPLVFPLWVFLVSVAILLNGTTKRTEHPIAANRR
jgi:hypothetical protein